MDRLLSLLPRFGFQASVFFRGRFCGRNHFPEDGDAGQLHLLRAGHVTMVHADGSVLDLTEPTLVFYPRPYEHQLIVPPGAHADLLCATVRFKHFRRNPLALSLPGVMAVPLGEFSSMATTLALLFAEADSEELGSRLVLDNLCDILIIYLVRYALRQKLVQAGMLAGLWDAQLAPLLSALHTEPGRSWTIGEMAAEAHMSRTAFANRFRNVVGEPPAEYLSNWRMELAQTLLGEGKSVKEIAQAVGYRTQPAFTRAFTDKYGVAPTEWLKQRRERELEAA